jgi:hypothetical protein
MKSMAIDLATYLLGFLARACKAIPLVALYVVVYVLWHIHSPLDYRQFDWSMGVATGMALYYMVNG